MSRIYDAEKEAKLEADIQSIETDVAETSAKLQEFEGKPLEDDGMVNERNELLAKHSRLTNDHKVMTERLTQMRLFKPADKLPETERNEEIEALDAMIRSQEPRGEKMEVSLDALVLHQESRMVGRSDISTNADGAAGGATETRTQATIVDVLKAYGSGLNVIPIIETADGNEMQWPVTDQTSLEGEMLGNEGTQVTKQDLKAVTDKPLAVKRFSSKMVDLSNTLIQDSVFDIVSYATMQCAQRIGRAISRKIVTATEAADGIDGFKSLAIPVSAASKTAFPVIDDSTRMIHSIDRAYLSGQSGLGSSLMAGSGLNNTGGFVGFLVSYDALRVLRTAKDGEQRPLWQPNVRVGEPSMLMGHPVMVVDELDAFSSTATTGDMPILFGNFTYFQGRFAKNITIERFYDSGTALGDFTSFLGMARFGMRSIIQANAASKNPAVAGYSLP